MRRTAGQAHAAVKAVRLLMLEGLGDFTANDLPYSAANRC